MTDLCKAAAGLLRERFPEAMIAGKEVAGGMKLPAFILTSKELSLKKEMGRRWRLEETAECGCYAEKEFTALEQAELLSLLRRAARGVTAEAEREANRLLIRMNLTQLLFLEEEEAALMKQMILNMRREI